MHEGVVTPFVLGDEAVALYPVEPSYRTGRHVLSLCKRCNAMMHIRRVQETSRMLEALIPREERIVRMRFGIGVDEEKTLEQIGQQFAVTRERIRQIEAKALRTLKHPKRSRRLQSFLDR